MSEEPVQPSCEEPPAPTVQPPVAVASTSEAAAVQEPRPPPPPADNGTTPGIGEADAAVMAHLAEMIAQVMTIAGTEGAERDAQYDVLAAMLSEATGAAAVAADSADTPGATGG